MKKMRSYAAVAALLCIAAGCQKPAGNEQSNTANNSQAGAVKTSTQINGEDVVTLKRKRTGDGKQPQFLSATIIPGRGMNLFQVMADVPGLGPTPILASPSIEDAAKVLTGSGDDQYGVKNFSFGGAFLVPFANRIVGTLSEDKKTVSFEWHGEKRTLPANWKGKNPGAVPHAIHGLILDAKATNVNTSDTGDGGTISGDIDAGDFGGKWFSQSQVHIEEKLSGNAVDVMVTVKNTGDKPEPIGIGWHPYFALPSGKRDQVKLHIPGDMLTEVNNYDDVFPTGKLVPVKGTPLDFTAPGGATLPNKLVDDNWTHLKKAPDGSSVNEIIDPAANYGIRITAVSKEINSVQAYAPTDPGKTFIALEPQYNLADPFGKEWKGRDTYMVTLKPGESTTWHVRLELFIPQTGAAGSTNTK